MAFSIFTSQVPALQNQTDGVTQNLGTVFRSSSNGTVTHVRWFFPTVLPTGTVIGALWSWTNDGAGTLLSQANFVTPSAGAWNTVALPSPIAITAGTYYVASVFSQDRYVATSALFNGTAISNGPLTAPADDSITPRRNGKFLQSQVGLSYPTGFFNGNGYFPDIVFEEEAPPADEVFPDSITLTTVLGEPAVSMGVSPDSITMPMVFGSPTVSGAPSPGRDDLVPALYEKLLECLCAGAAGNPNRPAICAPRVGTEVLYDMGQFTDQCCEGLAYIMLGDTFISSTSFPEQDIVQQIEATCAPPTWAQVFKIGIVRCISAGQPDGEPITEASWLASARQNMYDAQSLRYAACCFRNWVTTQYGTLYDGMNVVLNRQTQTNPQGGCIERYMTVTVQFPDIDCTCP